MPRSLRDAFECPLSYLSLHHHHLSATLYTTASSLRQLYTYHVLLLLELGRHRPQRLRIKCQFEPQRCKTKEMGTDQFC